MQPQEMRRRVGEARHGYLGTAGPSGRPHLVPFCFVLDADTIYSSVDWKPKRRGSLQRLRNIRRQPLVSVLVDDYSEDWSRLWWVRLDGRADELEPGLESERALGLLAAKYEQYRALPPQGPVIRVGIERWAGWSAQ